MKSISLYRKAYRADSQGDTAPAALYGLSQSYSGLYRWSRNPLDRQQSQKALEDLVRQFPDSTYAASGQELFDHGATTGGDRDTVADVIRSADVAVSAPPGGSQEKGISKPAVVEGLRYWSNPRYTRVVVDADSDAVFSYHELREDPTIGKPQRIYIDLHNSRLSNQLQRVVPINDDLLSDARAGQYSKDTVRVVVDIKSSKTFKIFSLKNPFRIVLDVWGEESASVASSGPASPAAGGGDLPSDKLPQSAIVRQLALGVRRIVIDPGHGGKDFGAPGYLKNVHEKHVVLQIGQRLADKIRSQLKCDVVLTRSQDTYLSLEERTAIANTQNADLFISIHTNASPDKRASGMETFILNLATDDEAIRVAARENATSTKNISDLDSILQDLMQNAKVSESTRLASYVQQAAVKQLKRKYKGIRNKGIKKAPFYVLLGAQMPSILVETAFISNPKECKRLTTPTYQDQLCQGIVDGIKRYIEETHPVAFEGAAYQRERG
ncbi:MAG: N-acetylmuramoyl-L-alanine amidase [Desulfatitalea sp.]|nr:N-acetylmuramoyl-L-alanine amidase [Desulfatitalea sp.]NNK01972.1 N-acetylmuramoyl-L-alanine amidase [Desulfatitalea sp.]